MVQVATPRRRSDITPFRIEVMEGPAAGAVVELVGRMLPYRGGAGGSISFGGTQRSGLIWYPGNPNATQNIFGPELKPTTIDGIWKERYLGNDVPIDLVEQFEEIRDSGAQLQVTWSTIERQGILKDFDWVPGNPTGGLGDIAWTATFEWNSSRRTIGRAVLDTNRPMRDKIVEAADSFSDLRDIVESATYAVEAFVGLTHALAAPFRGDVDDFLLNGVGALDSLIEAARRHSDNVELPVRVYQDATSAAESAVDLSAEVADVFANEFPGATCPVDEADILLLQAIDRYAVIRQSFVAFEALYEAVVVLENELRPDGAVEVFVTARTDLRELAVRFYGDADLWQRIAAANGIVEGSKIPDDVTSVLIPAQLSSVLDNRI